MYDYIEMKNALIQIGRFNSDRLYYVVPTKTERKQNSSFEKNMSFPRTFTSHKSASDCWSK